MSRKTARLVAVLAGFLASSPVGFLLIHKPEPVGWGGDPWFAVAVMVGAPGAMVGSALANQHPVARLVVAFLFCWIFYGSICYLVLLPFRRKT